MGKNVLKSLFFRLFVSLLIVLYQTAALEGPTIRHGTLSRFHSSVLHVLNSTFMDRVRASVADEHPYCRRDGLVSLVELASFEFLHEHPSRSHLCSSGNH